MPETKTPISEQNQLDEKIFDFNTREPDTVQTEDFINITRYYVYAAYKDLVHYTNFNEEICIKSTKKIIENLSNLINTKFNITAENDKKKKMLILENFMIFLCDVLTPSLAKQVSKGSRVILEQVERDVVKGSTKKKAQQKIKHHNRMGLTAQRNNIVDTMFKRPIYRTFNQNHQETIEVPLLGGIICYNRSQLEPANFVMRVNLRHEQKLNSQMISTYENGGTSPPLDKSNGKFSPLDKRIFYFSNFSDKKSIIEGIYFRVANYVKPGEEDLKDLISPDKNTKTRITSASNEAIAKIHQITPNFFNQSKDNKENIINVDIISLLTLTSNILGYFDKQDQRKQIEAIIRNTDQLNKNIDPSRNNTDQSDQKQFSKIKTQLREIKAQLREIKAQLSEIKTQLSETKTQLSEIKTKLIEIKTKLGEIKIELKPNQPKNKNAVTIGKINYKIKYNYINIGVNSMRFLTATQRQNEICNKYLQHFFHSLFEKTQCYVPFTHSEISAAEKRINTLFNTINEILKKPNIKEIKNAYLKTKKLIKETINDLVEELKELDKTSNSQEEELITSGFSLIKRQQVWSIIEILNIMDLYFNGTYSSNEYNFLLPALIAKVAYNQLNRVVLVNCFDSKDRTGLTMVYINALEQCSYDFIYQRKYENANIQTLAANAKELIKTTQYTDVSLQNSRYNAGAPGFETKNVGIDVDPLLIRSAQLGKAALHPYISLCNSWLSLKVYLNYIIHTIKCLLTHKKTLKSEVEDVIADLKAPPVETNAINSVTAAAPSNESGAPILAADNTHTCSPEVQQVKMEEEEEEEEQHKAAAYPVRHKNTEYQPRLTKWEIYKKEYAKKQLSQNVKNPANIAPSAAFLGSAANIPLHELIETTERQSISPRALIYANS